MFRVLARSGVAVNKFRVVAVVLSHVKQEVILALRRRYLSEANRVSVTFWWMAQPPTHR